MSSLIEHVERAEVARWEAVLNEEPKCESPHHYSLPNQHGGQVTHTVVGPCPHVRGLRCEQWVVRTRNLGLRCSQCGMGYVPPDQIRFIEI